MLNTTIKIKAINLSKKGDVKMAWELKAVEEQRMLLIEHYASGEYTVTELSERCQMIM